MNAAENSTVYTTDTTANYEHYTHSGRHYSPQAEALLKGLIQGGKHAKNAITTIAGVAKLDVDNADKIYRALRIAGLTLPSIVLLMLNAPASVLLASLTGAGIGFLGNKGAKEALKVKNARRRAQEALELTERYNGRIQFLENDLEHSKMKIKSKFEAFQFLYMQQIETLQDEISSQQTLILEQSMTLNQNEAKKQRLEQHLKKQFGAEVEKIITEANQKIETGNHETRKALSLRDDMANRLQHADRLCKTQAQEIAQLEQDKRALKNEQRIDEQHQILKAENTHLVTALECTEKVLEGAKIEIAKMTEDAETTQKRLKSENKDLRRMANLKEEIINDMSKLSDDSRLSVENKALKVELKEERAEVKRLNNKVLSSKNETINAQQQQIKVLEFSLKYATLNEKPDTGNIEGRADSKRYTAIIEGVKIGAITSISQKDLGQFRYAGKSISPRIVTRYQQALVRDGYAEKGAGGFKLVVIK